jgi:hypothetical protein
MAILVPTLLLALAAPPAGLEPTPAVPPASTPAEPRPRSRPHLLGPLGSAGIVVGSAGVGVAIAGIVRMTQPDVPRSELGQFETITFTNTRIQGGILLGAGLAVAAAGATMLAVDLTVLRKRAARLAVAPALAPAMAGLDLRIRF